MSDPGKAEGSCRGQVTTIHSALLRASLSPDPYHQKSLTFPRPQAPAWGCALTEGRKCNWGAYDINKQKTLSFHNKPS